MAWTVLERLLQTLQSSGGATGGPRRAQGAVCPLAAQRARAGPRRGGAGPAAGAARLAGRTAGAADSLKRVRGRSPKRPL
jgi:hypothetical protein